MLSAPAHVLCYQALKRALLAPLLSYPAHHGISMLHPSHGSQLMSERQVQRAALCHFTSDDRPRGRSTPGPQTFTMSLPFRSAVGFARPEDWECHKQRIAQLYWEEDRPLREVADIMSEKHNFKATYVSSPCSKICRVSMLIRAQVEDVQEASSTMGFPEEFINGRDQAL
jgi:hypothetical protein